MARKNIIFDEIAAPIFQNTDNHTYVRRRRESSPDENRAGEESNSSEKNQAASNEEGKQQTQVSSGEDKDVQEHEDKEGGKDEEEGSAIAKRAEKLAEDPFMTPSESMAMDGGSKEKEKKSESEDGGKSRKKQKPKDQSAEAKKELDVLVSRAEKILFSAKALFPFDFYGSTITIDANKVNIRIKTFFFTETVTSVMLKEIMDVRVHATLFFGKLIIDYGPHPLKIKTVYLPNLKKGDALKAKEIIEGNLILYRGENVDTTKLKPEETLAEVEEVGKAEEVE